MSYLNVFFHTVWLSYKHNQGPAMPMGTPNHPPMIAVTACVDKISKHLKLKIMESIF